VNTISMTEAQIGALHDLAVAFKGSELDITPAAHFSLDVTIFTPGTDEGYFATATFSVSISGTVRARDTVTA
jgi:hypothetical protein